ncbi:MAG: LEA type 2 family protein [Candidatus Aminicenantaceae bacterium]
MKKFESLFSSTYYCILKYSREKAVKRLRRICLFLTILCVFSSLALSRSWREDLSITLKKNGIKDFDISGLTLIFYVNISNSSSSAYYLTGYNYRIMVKEKEYFRKKTPLNKEIKIGPKKNTLLSFPLKVTYAHLFNSVEGIEQEDEAQCFFTGTMTFSDGRKEKGVIRFSFSGEFPIFKLPEVEFHSLQVHDLTIGGADLSYELSFKNNNVFELLVERINFKFHLGTRPISNGVISRNENIKSRGKKIYSFPLLLNFFDVGKEIYDILHQSSALSRFSGEIIVKTMWGRVKIPFDKSQKVTISRSS